MAMLEIVSENWQLIVGSDDTHDREKLKCLNVFMWQNTSLYILTEKAAD
jgi:hypothetical protein